jgi:hypothetical protein
MLLALLGDQFCHRSVCVDAAPPPLLLATPAGCRPPAGGVNVYVSAICDHLVDVDDSKYRFEAVLFLLLTWTDVRARPAIEAASLAAQTSSYNNGNGCAYPCTTLYAWTAKPGALDLW